MGDISEMRAVIVILAFVVFTVTLVGLMVSESPSMFMGIAQGSSGTSTDQTASPSSLLAWNQSYSLVLNVSDAYFPLGGWNVLVSKLEWGEKGIFMTTYDSWWIFQWNFDDFKWYTPDNQEVTHILSSGIPSLLLNTIDSEYAVSNNTKYIAKNTKTQFGIFFTWNKTAYATPSNAYDNNSLVMIFNIDFNDRNTSINALSFIGGIFTFSLPGLPFIPNLILWLMIFPAAMYLAFIFVLRIIGAVFGGGGA